MSWLMLKCICMERYVKFEEGEFYHVYNRGVDKRKIFFVDKDWQVFQWMLYARNGVNRIDIPSSLGGSWRASKKQEKPLVDVIAYAFMDNHFHLLLKERQEGGISKFMKKLLTSYAMYMNTKYDRTGPLMCRPFRSQYINSDEYLRWVISYIHLNPVDKIEPKWKDNGLSNPREAQKFLKTYRFSSYVDYFGSIGRCESLILNKEALPINIRDLDSLKDMLVEYSSKEYLDDGKWASR